MNFSAVQTCYKTADINIEALSYNAKKGELIVRNADDTISVYHRGGSLKVNYVDQGLKRRPANCSSISTTQSAKAFSELADKLGQYRRRESMASPARRSEADKTIGRCQSLIAYFEGDVSLMSAINSATERAGNAVK